MHHGGTCRRLSLKTCTSSLNVKLTNDCVFLMAMTIQSSVSKPKLKLDTESIITQVNVHDHFSHLQNIRTSGHDKPKHVKTWSPNRLVWQLTIAPSIRLWKPCEETKVQTLSICSVSKQTSSNIVLVALRGGTATKQIQ